MALNKFVSLLMVFALMVSGCQGCAAVTYIEREKLNYISSNSNVDHMMNSVVAMVQEDEEHHLQTFCTAFFVAPNKLATAAHCVATREQLEVLPGLTIEVTSPPRLGTRYQYVTYLQFQLARRDVSIQPYVATVAAFDVEKDVAILQLTSTSPRSQHVLRINSTNIRVGETVYAVGHPAGLVWTLTTGIISRVLRSPNGTLEEVQSSVQIFFGNSGGPLVNDRGEVIGVASAMVGRQAHLGIFSPIRDITTLLNGLLPTSLRQ